MSEALIVNASPLVFLGKAGSLELLRGIGLGRVIVPAAVVEEVVASGHSDRAGSALAAADWIERPARAAIPTGVVEWDLGAGESEVIALALATPGARAVIDDLAARRCARALGVEVIGTLGVVIAASRRGLVTDPRHAIEELRAAGMWLSDAVIARALKLAGVE